ncbi:SusD family protein [Salegentibacter echinorum]|uniref:SusD family protein n=1 Tax=Salegentibacter echinorum TaxID=1073325 RepID=A0A1M5MA18_SALEC|nr:RagB/SusD family nutrient uptake outer membrane protein [Salegentibacter echinorum]SHG74194.1 SusD family protein [Salegentibacter echinorum]
MKLTIYIKRFIVIVIYCCISSCEDYVEIEAPDHKIGSEVIFNNDQIARSAMTGIYNQMSFASLTSGRLGSYTVLGDLSSDILELRTTSSSFQSYLEFQEHEIQPSNLQNLNLWSGAYNLIYMSNSLLEGLARSEQITETVHKQLEGEARFVRAFTYFYLVNLYGDVPLLLSTNYKENSLSGRHPITEVYQQIEMDLNEAAGLLGEEYLNGERTQVNAFAAKALLARVYLFQEKWELAEKLSSEVISQSGTYEILDNLNEVFLANSREAIWQISPIGKGSGSTNTNEGSVFIIHPSLPVLSRIKLSEDFVGHFSDTDNRMNHWIAFHQRVSAYHPFKYKIRNSSEPVTEYSMVLRLAEQYLIRSEALLMQGKLDEAIADVNIIRKRANLDLIEETNPSVSREELMDIIQEERSKELFAEWGHRWLDLKRTRKVDVLSSDSPLWENTDVLYPIPEEERIKNPNLEQNQGY